MKLRITAVCLAAVMLLTALLPVPASAAYENTYKNTGDQRADIIGVALTQVGYIEESGGVTKYGQWFGRPTADWCGIFISWCAAQAGIPTSVLRKNGLASPSGFGFSTYYSGSQYTPKPGDLFFTPSRSGGFSHAGIVYYVDGEYFYTLEGNTWVGSSPHGVMTKQRVLRDYVFVSPNYNGSGGSLPASCSHSWKDDGIVSAPTCTAGGTKNQVCSKCGAKRTASISAKGHSYGDWTEKDEKSHQRTCGNCKKVETKNHDDMKWLWDSAGHWQECQTCLGQFQVEPHTYAGECGTKCTVCEYASQDGHNYSTWEMDDTGHWQVCDACEKKSEIQPHSFRNSCDEDCEDCGYARIVEHPYEMKTNAKSHWVVCTACQKEEAKEQHIPGPEADEENGQVCTVCAYVLAEKLTHVHEYTYTSDSLRHWGRCDCGETTEPESHIWSVESGTCSLCGTAAEITEETFNWDLVWLCGGGVIACATVLWVLLTLRKKKQKVAE